MADERNETDESTAGAPPAALTGLRAEAVTRLGRNGAGWVLRQVVSEAARQYDDPAVVQRELAALEEQLYSGAIDEAEFDRKEDELLDRLNPTHDWLTR